MTQKLMYLLKNSPFQKKIMIMAVLSALVPLLVLTFFSFTLIQHFVTEREETNNLDNLNAATQQLENKLSSYEDGLSFLINNNQLVKGLSLDNPTNFEQYYFYINDVVPLFKNMMYQQPDVLGITLYTSLDFYNHGDYVKKIVPGDLTSKLPLNQSTEASYFFNKETNQLFLYSHLFSKKSQDINLIVFELDAIKLFQHLPTLSNEPYQLIVRDESGSSLYRFSNEKTRLGHDPITTGIRLFNHRSLKNEATIPQTKWTISFSRPYAQIYRGFVLLILATLAVFALSIILLTFFISHLSKSIVSPLEQLAKEMETIPTGHLSLSYVYKSEDEIGQLYQRFETMLHQINTLIHEVYEGEITQKKHELRALQAQINPHFFYNSLSLINNKAIMTGNEEISDMALLLSQYYRLSLNSGKHTISIEKELDLTIAYAKIQQKMHHGSFDLETHIDTTIHHLQMINLLIQPFVENAIFHGIDHIEDGRKGKLVIEAISLGDCFQFKVTDNGAGMSLETQRSILNHPSQHYGLKNVQQRILLYYGKEHAITCHSDINKGTTFTITLPNIT